jgi:hypothetical protein
MESKIASIRSRIPNDTIPLPYTCKECTPLATNPTLFYLTQNRQMKNPIFKAINAHPSLFYLIEIGRRDLSDTFLSDRNWSEDQSDAFLSDRKQADEKKASLR